MSLFIFIGADILLLAKIHFLLHLLPYAKIFVLCLGVDQTSMIQTAPAMAAMFGMAIWNPWGLILMLTLNELDLELFQSARRCR